MGKHIEMTPKLKQITNTYFENGAFKLHKMVDKILFKLGFHNVDKEEYYSLSHELFYYFLEDYDESKEFDSFLYSCLYRKFCTEMTFLNRDKRCNNIKVKKRDENGNVITDENGNPIIEKIKVQDISIDTPINENEDYSIVDTIKSDFNMFDNLESEECFEENTICYLQTLSPTQRKIAKLIMDGYALSDIKEELNLNDKQYENHMKHMRCFEKTSILTRNNDIKMEEKSMSNSQTFEKSKMEKYSIASIIKKMNNRTLRYDHPLQRESDQHSTKMKSNLMSDILQGNPIPALVFAEQVINGISITWNLDGKQRSSNVKEFTEDKFKISKSVRRGLIKYQAIIKDENGNVIPDENGFPQAEWREFNIINKRFSQLPDELKEKFMDYCFDVTLYMNCSDEDIAYHIERYNDGKQMASSQKGVIKLGEDYARMIKGISAMPFFSENGFNYTQKKNGTIDRVCIESVMATEFLDDWKTSPEDIAAYLKKNATEEHFDNLEDTIERLEKVVTDDIGELFDKKDAFIYFSVFARFKKTGLDDRKFVEFLTEYAQSLHNKFEEIEYDKDNNKKRSTKDKYVVVTKINIVDKLMREYLNIKDEDIKEVDCTEFVKSNVEDTTDEDVEFYEEVLEDLTLNVDNNSKLLDKHNRPSLLALVGYSVKNDIDLDEWIVEFFKNNTTYILNQVENYKMMLNSLQKKAVA